MISRFTAGLIVLVLVLSALSFGLSRAYLQAVAKTRQAQEATQQAQGTLKAVQASTVAREAVRASRAREGALAGQSVQAATRSTPEAVQWSQTETPKEIQNALCAVVRCADAERVQHDASTN